MRALVNGSSWWKPALILCLAILLMAPSLAANNNGKPPVNGLLYGFVTNALTGQPLAGATITVGDYSTVSAADGRYKLNLPVDHYVAYYEADYFDDYEDDVVIYPKVKTARHIAMDPVAPVVVEASAGSGYPGDTVSLSYDVIVLDGSSVMGAAWSQTCGVDAAVSGSSATLAGLADYKDGLIHHLSSPAIGPDQLPPNVPVPPDHFVGGLQDRFQVVGINPFALEETALVCVEVAVTTTSGTYYDHTEVHTYLPWDVTAGINNVPLNVTVLLHGKEQDSYSWTLDTPSGSSATLADAGGQNPMFTPDVEGTYELSVTDTATSTTVEFDVNAGTWVGVIVGQDGDGRPVADTACTGCHSGTIAPDTFTPWAQTGHAEIFTNNLNTSTHYGEGCFACHTVGFGPDAVNGSFDEASDYQAFLDSGMLNNPGDNWTTMLDDFPEAARLANIQCENCHGPQASDGHANGTQRNSISSDVCATCHGEPLRHARFQQWQLSAHANYELAVDESQSGSCSKCHTGNGFLAWLPVLLGDEPGDPGDSVTVTWTEDEAHPQTCVTCHDPHNIGSTTGDDTDAIIRISDVTPELAAGFTAIGVGKGAICMTCHNTRRGLKNDSTWPDFVGTSESARAPHGGAQTDVLMGENAFLMEVGIRGGHSWVEDSCVDCHMNATDPPTDLAYNSGGTNHTFYASPDICGDCHSFKANGPNAAFPLPAKDTVDAIQHGTELALHDLEELLIEANLKVMDDLLAGGASLDLNGNATITDIDQIDTLVFGETRGRQGIGFVLADGTELSVMRYQDIDVIPGMGDAYGYYLALPEAVLQAGWNWALVHNDGSYGIHNPTFTSTALNRARGAVLEFLD